MARRKHRVEIGAAAHRDLAAIQAHIARDSPSNAARWVRAMQQRVRSLEALPLRHEVIPETAEVDFAFEYRHLVSGNYRIIYRVEEARVLVVRVIHAARLLTGEMLQDEPP